MRKFSVTDRRQKKIRKGLDDLNNIKSYLCTEKKDLSFLIFIPKVYFRPISLRSHMISDNV